MIITQYRMSILNDSDYWFH